MLARFLLQAPAETLAAAALSRRFVAKHVGNCDAVNFAVRGCVDLAVGVVIAAAGR